MNAVKIPMGRDKKIALVAHDNMKRDRLEWTTFNRDLLAHHVVYTTGTTAFLSEFRGERRLDLVIEGVVREAAS